MLMTSFEKHTAWFFKDLFTIQTMHLFPLILRITVVYFQSSSLNFVLRRCILKCKEGNTGCIGKIIFNSDLRLFKSWNSAIK